MEIDIAHLKGWIGKEQRASEVLSPNLVTQFNATFDRQSDVKPGSIAPLLIHFCLTQPVSPNAELGPDGHPTRGGFLPPVPLPRRMWAGGAFEFHGDIHIGGEITRRSTIRDVTLKHGRSGPLCFVTVDHEIRCDGALAINERQDIVYRDVPTPGAAAVAAPADIAKNHRTITPTAALLFRYSAMTFNGHRIHYDKPYVTEVEGYPGLIVHGPMQATLLCQMAADMRGLPPKTFSFRSLSPIFDDADFSLNAEETENGIQLWTARVDGPIAMQAEAKW